MWEVSSGQPPFINFNHDYYLALKIINGMRPKIVPGTPLEYEKLMKLCWDADPNERPDIFYLDDKICEINKLYYQNNDQEPALNIDSNINDTNFNAISINSSFSRVYSFAILPVPRNATKEEQKGNSLIYNNNNNNHYCTV
ncbi:hypothetical protein C1645_766182 [Glomus cerebriforme]|uniref:Serine-threonine/tyrosine-protein kinase catalytic domain-containing protein n=1 Tax=Glomus cerebriforme TaxID=658196 RepID=A0A397T6T9_9GLOM|nr:hypothetical protein C1645_766182 [Glomus cerebriforme]